MTTKDEMFKVISKIALAKKELKKAYNQIAAYEYDQDIKKLEDELIALNKVYEHKRATLITPSFLESNGFEVAIPRVSLPFRTWRLKDNTAFWFDEYEEDREYLDDGEFGLVKKGTFLLRFANKRVQLETASDLEDALSLCGIDISIQVKEE